jgi:hypothetical protein
MALCFHCQGSCEAHEVVANFKCNGCGVNTCHHECLLAYKKGLSRRGLPVSSAKDKRTNIKCPVCPKVRMAPSVCPLFASWAAGGRARGAGCKSRVGKNTADAAGRA